MPRTAGSPILTSINFYSSEANPSTNLGALAFSDDGRAFRYVKAGASALVIGNAIQAPAQVTNFKDMAVQAGVAAGATVIPVTLGASSTTANQFVGGTLTISVGTSQIGQHFTILAHDVATNGTTCNFTVLEPVQVALTTSGKASAVVNPWNGVIQQPTAHTGVTVGGAVSPVAASNYGWVQCKGVGAALADATVTAATTMAMTPSVSTAGCLTLAVSLDQNVAISMYTVTVSAEVEPVFWLL